MRIRAVFRSDAAEQRPDAQPGQDADDERSQGSSSRLSIWEPPGL